MTEFPEHDKLEKVSTERSIILKFVDWIEDNNMVICFDSGDPTEYVPIKDEDRLIDTFFGINTDVLKKERKNASRNLAMLADSSSESLNASGVGKPTMNEEESMKLVTLDRFL